MANPSAETLVNLTTQIVSAHVSHNAVSPDQLPILIQRVFDTLGNMINQGTNPITPDQGTMAPVNQAEPAHQDPAVPAEESVFRDSIVCLTCGNSYKMLKRHLMSDHDMTPEQYREKWNLPADYPMVAPAYAQTRSILAKQIGLGLRRANRP